MSLQSIKPKHKLLQDVFKYLRYFVLVAFSVTSIYPFVWVVLNSVKTNHEILARPFSLPAVWMFENYLKAITAGQIGLNFKNSIIISFGAVAVLILITSMAAYILSRVWPNLSMYIFFTLGIMIPVQTLLIPSFILLKGLSLNNKTIGLILVYIVSNISLSIFVLVGFMKGLPYEMEESARIDGCSMTLTFFSIIFPLSKPGLATIGTLAFLNCWNEYLFAYVLISNPKLKTLTQGIMAIRGQHFTDYSLLCAGLAISIIPVVIMYIVFQEQVIKGMTAGAIKG